MKIQRARIGTVQPGESITDVDNDSLLTDDEINDVYDASLLPWDMVLRWIEGGALVQIELGTADGEVERYPVYDWDLWTWVLTDDDGERIKNPMPESEE